MIRSLHLSNYRGFRQFEMHNLGRVNLIVGTNNAGKTSVLEALHIVESPGEYGPILGTLTRRGEDAEEREGPRLTQHVDVRRLFHGHEIALESELRIHADTDHGPDTFRAIFTESSPSSETLHSRPQELIESSLDFDYFPNPVSLGLHWTHEWTRNDVSALLDLTRQGSLMVDSTRRAGARLADGPRMPIRLITAASLAPDAIINLFEEVVLTPAEDFVIEALRIIEPSIERIATSGTERRRLASRTGFRGGLLVRCQGVRGRIPIGSMGDGIWRMLGLALALARTEGGILLVDEIDTGLHYSVMENMWRMVRQTAVNLGIQVFATTHSRDCYESLAAISRNVGAGESDVTMQRIERGRESAVAYSEREIIAAAKRHIEVR